MNAGYIGILTPGSTSRMRAETLRNLRPEWTWNWLDTDSPLVASARLWQSLAYRLNSGAAVSRVNAAVIEGIGSQSYDLLWVDKAIFLTPETVRSLRSSARRLVHFTPDTAFHANRSRHFEQTLGLFDLLVTTKSFELDDYRRRLKRDSLRLITQGYDARVHYPRNGNESRGQAVVFVGLAEPDRERCISTLLERDIDVKLAGNGWSKFVEKWKGNSRLQYLGSGLFGDAYATLLSESWIGLGLLSKRFPELHTTRTFEISACGAILATERSLETSSFFSNNEAIFFDNHEQLADAIVTAFRGSDEELAAIASAGRRRVISDGREYSTILAGILSDPRIGL